MTRFLCLRSPVASALLLCAGLAAAVSPAAAQPVTASPHDPAHHAAGHDAMPGMAMSMTSPLGPYAMARDASGTGWQPDATPMEGLHRRSDPWALMLHGFVNAIHDHQRGPRGDDQAFVQSMLMGMAERPLGPGKLGLRAMLSLDPTIGRRGYPLLFQTGETADGQSHLVDRQHPHDFFMELSGTYSLNLGADSAAFVYAGLPGEPALGPPTFMHRYSGMRNPEAPLTHHWLDSTHITFGVVTAGASRGPFKLEGSWFNGREPDQSRWNIETRSFDSWSARASYNPLPQLSMQLSHGRLKSPEQLEPETRVRRTTASATLQLAPGGMPWATTLAWGRNTKVGPDERHTQPGWLLESTAVLGRHTVFGRAEQVRTDELFEDGDTLAGRDFRVRKFELGYVFDLTKTGPVTWGLGLSAATFDVPADLKAAYGDHPRSLLLFLQGRL